MHKVRCYFTTATLLLYYSRWMEGQRVCMDDVTPFHMARPNTYFKHVDIDIDIAIDISICRNQTSFRPMASLLALEELSVARSISIVDAMPLGALLALKALDLAARFLSTLNLKPYS